MEIRKCLLRIPALVFLLAAVDLTSGAPTVLMLMPQRSMDAGFFVQNEATVMIDLLAQAGYSTAVATVDGKAFGTAGHALQADLQTSAVQLEDYVAVLLPCMGAGDYPATKDNVAVAKEADARGMIVAGENVEEVLYPSGLTRDHKTARAPGVVVDGNLITSYNCPYMAQQNGKAVDTRELIAGLLKLIREKDS